MVDFCVIAHDLSNRAGDFVEVYDTHKSMSLDVQNIGYLVYNTWCSSEVSYHYCPVMISAPTSLFWLFF